MKTKKRVLPALLLSIFAAAPTAADAQQFSGVYVFGDSLSDAGYYRPFLASLGLPANVVAILGRFTTNPGPVWSEAVSQRYGFTPGPSNVSGGNIFAQGGARVSSASPSTPPGSAQRPVSTQIDEFLARTSGTADPNALYSVWVGAIDLFVQLTALQSGAITQAQLQSNVLGAASAEIAQIGRLQVAGARYILVFGLPDIGATPRLAAAGAATAGAVTQLSAGYNTTLFSGLASAGIRVIPVDTFALLSEIRANPAAYGFTNVTSIACGPFPPITSTGNSQFCLPTNLVAPNAAQTYLFADDIHPTSGAHAILAQFVESLIEGPTAYSLLAEAPLASRRLHVRSMVDSLTHAQLNQSGRWNVFVTADRGDLTIDPNNATTGIDGRSKGFNFGVTARVSESVVLGAAVGHREFDGGFGRDMGDFSNSENVLSLIGAMRLGRFWGNGVLSLSDIQFRTIHRNIVLGPVVRVANAHASGSNASAYFSAGYDFALARLSVGPMVAVTSQNVDVNGFDEADAGSANLRISGQKRRSEVWSAGLRAYLTGHAWLPWVRVTADRERRDDVRFVTASPLSMATGNTYDIPAYSPDKNSTTAAVGIHGTVMQTVGLSLSYYKVFGRSGVKEDGINGVVSVRF